VSLAGSRNVRTAHYKKQLAALPERIQELAELLFERFCEDPAAPELANHELYDSSRGQHRQGSRAVSVTRRYRAIYVVDE
jgi:hypothetical protein